VRQHVSSGTPLELTIGFSRAVRDESQVFVSATAAIWPDGHVDPDVSVQARRCLDPRWLVEIEADAIAGD
jgi:hypothetical protein